MNIFYLGRPIWICAIKQIPFEYNWSVSRYRTDIIVCGTELLDFIEAYMYRQPLYMVYCRSKLLRLAALQWPSVVVQWPSHDRITECLRGVLVKQVQKFRYIKINMVNTPDAAVPNDDLCPMSMVFAKGATLRINGLLF